MKSYLNRIFLKTGNKTSGVKSWCYLHY